MNPIPFDLNISEMIACLGKYQEVVPMDDNQGFLLRDSQTSKWSESRAAVDNKMDEPLMMHNGPPEAQSTDKSENVDNLTYVSSRGYFFY